MAHFTSLRSLPAWFWDHVDRGGPRPEMAPALGRCWIWHGPLDREGYGKLSIATGVRGGRTTGAHRAAFLVLVGPIPDGLVLDHLCRVRNCVNPAHLEAVTTRENIRRGLSGKANNWQRRKTHCKHGHEFTPENTRLRDGRWRICIECAKRRQAEHLRSRSAA